MGKISDQLNAYQQLRQQTEALNDTSNVKGLRPDLLAWIWRAMADWFGHKWTSHVGTEPLDSWAYGLAGLSPQQIRTGLDTLTTSGREWPPSLPEFRALCDGTFVDKTDGAAIAAAMSPVRALPQPPAVIEKRKTRAKEEMVKWRKILNVA